MSDIVRKIESAPATPSTGGSSSSGTDRGNLDRDIRLRVVASTQSGQKKRAEVWSEGTGRPTSSRWSIECDESARLGGDDAAPSPLAYFSAGIAF